MLTILAVVISLIYCCTARPTQHRRPPAVERPPTHAYPPSYNFNIEDGWEFLHASPDGYTRDANGPNATHARLSERDTVTDLLDSIKALGSAEAVKLTWYSGEGLLDPSCWAQAVWQPTDDSYVCAITLDGWTNKPKCFDFLELCNGPTKCVSCRVVDSCAGCEGKHVDVSQSTFKALAPLSQGVIEDVQMRLASGPTGWSNALWGPQAS